MSAPTATNAVKVKMSDIFAILRKKLKFCFCFESSSESARSRHSNNKFKAKLYVFLKKYT